MSQIGSLLLTAAATVSLLIALLQFVMFFGGAKVYRACGTPEPLIEFCMSRRLKAFLVEILIAAVFVAFAGYGYSGAGRIEPLRFTAQGLAVTAAVYLFRGTFVVLQLTWLKRHFRTRDIVYSCMAIAQGVAYGVPTWLHWSALPR